MQRHRGCGSQRVMIGCGRGSIAVGDTQKEKYNARQVRNGNPESPGVGRRQPASAGPVQYVVLATFPPPWCGKEEVTLQRSNWRLIEVIRCRYRDRPLNSERKCNKHWRI